MTPADIRTTLLALTQSDHHFHAIRPADATPAEAPAIMLTYPSANALQYALNDAAEYWPTTTTWALIASDEKLLRVDPTWPATMRAFRKPLTIATFAA